MLLMSGSDSRRLMTDIISAEVIVYKLWRKDYYF